MIVKQGKCDECHEYKLVAVLYTLDVGYLCAACLLHAAHEIYAKETEKQ